MSRPTFSILLPTKDRASLVPDALFSILNQTFTDFEVILSNNGAASDVREALTSLLGDPRIRYLEQMETVSMPEHWELLSRLAIGQYQIVLTDRSVLHRNALSTIADIHARGGINAEIISWPWELFHEAVRMLEPITEHLDEAIMLESEEYIVDAFAMKSAFPLALPRGLNSSVSSSLINEIRHHIGAAFRPISPDFSFAYSCLMLRSHFTYLAKPLMTSQGLAISNGGNAYLTDGKDYLAALGLDEPIRYSPIKTLLAENAIAEDLFTACHQLNRSGLLSKLDRSALFLRCLKEIDAKYFAARLPYEQISEMERGVEEALAAETTDVQTKVRQQGRQLPQLVRRKLRRFLGTRIKHLRPFQLWLKGGKRFASALEAAGHNAQ